MKRLSALFLALVLSCGLLCAGALADINIEQDILFFIPQFHDVAVGYQQQPAVQDFVIQNTSSDSVQLNLTITNSSSTSGDSSSTSVDSPFIFSDKNSTYELNKQYTLTIPAGTEQNPGETTFAVQPVPNLPLGSYSVNLTFTVGEDTDNSKTVTIPFNVVETAAPRLQYDYLQFDENNNPIPYHFGDFFKGQEGSFPLRIRNVGSAKAYLSAHFNSVTSESDDPPFVMQQPHDHPQASGHYILNPGEALTYIISPQTNRNPGEYEDTFVVTYSSTSNAENPDSQNIPLSFKVIDGAWLVIDPIPPIEANVGYDPKPVPVTLRNNGTQSATINDISITPEPGFDLAFQLIGNPVSATIASGASETIQFIQPLPDMPVGFYLNQLKIDFEDSAAGVAQEFFPLYLGVHPLPAADGASDLPQTGDPSALPAWLALLGASGLMLLLRRRVNG